MKLRKFNDEGLSAFSQCLAGRRSGDAAATPFALLEKPELTQALNLQLPDACPSFATKQQMVEWLNNLFGSQMFCPDERDVGLWSWLAAYMFDVICPSGRKVNKDPHYILDILDYRRTYRHMVVAPWRLYTVAKGNALLFLSEKPYVHGELMEQGMGRLFLMRIPAIAEAMQQLYFDANEGCARRGIMSKTPKRGDFRNRFPARIQQLMLTYDMMSTDASNLVALLGPEFDVPSSGRQ